MRQWVMRTGISINVSPSDHCRLGALVRDRNAAQKHVWRAETVLPSAAGIGTIEIMRRTGKTKTCVAMEGTLRGRRRRWPIAR